MAAVTAGAPLPWLDAAVSDTLITEPSTLTRPKWRLNTDRPFLTVTHLSRNLCFRRTATCNSVAYHPIKWILQSPVVAIYTIRSNLLKPYILPTLCICVFRTVLTTATVSPHSINRLGSVAETWCVPCEVRTVSVCSVRFSQQTATVSPHSINRFGCVAET
jgi:hypothetical protein